MKSLQNITKETAYYRGKEITHAIGYDAYILELNKLDKKFGRVSGHGNSNMGFNAEKTFVDYLGREAHSAHASWDAVGHDGTKWEIRTRDFKRYRSALHFMGSTDKIAKPWEYKGRGESFDYIKKKCDAVDMFLVADTSRTGKKGLLEWWEVPSKAIIELYIREEWQQTITKLGKVRKPRDGAAAFPLSLTTKRFYDTMKWIFNK